MCATSSGLWGRDGGRERERERERDSSLHAVNVFQDRRGTALLILHLDTDTGGYRDTVPTEEEDWWVQDSVWAFWKRQKSLAPVRISALIYFPRRHGALDLCIPGMEHWWNNSDREKLQSSGKKILFQYHLVHHKFYMDCPGNEPSLAWCFRCAVIPKAGTCPAIGRPPLRTWSFNEGVHISWAPDRPGDYMLCGGA